MTAEVFYPGTLSQALSSNIIMPGSRLLLRGGYYPVGDMICNLRNVTLEPYPGEHPVLIPSSGYRILQLDGAHDIVIDGLIFDGTNVSNECIKITNGCYNITIRNCEIKNAGTQGILATNGRGVTTGITIQDNHLHHCGDDSLDHCIYVSVNDVTISGNEVNNSGGEGICIFGGADAYTTEITGNYVHNNASYGIGVFHGVSTITNNVCRVNTYGLYIAYGAMNTNAYHNTILGKLGVDEIYGTGVTINLKNNIVINGYYGLEIASLGAGNSINSVNNLIKARAGGSDYYYYPDATGVTITNDINAACTPVTDDDGEQFIPVDTNPAIDAGVDAGVTTDYAGTSRGNPPTIGAWE